MLPQLVSLNLSNNRISNLSLYGSLATATPNLMVLDLSGNSVSVCAHARVRVCVCMRCVDAIKGLLMFSICMCSVGE